MITAPPPPTLFRALADQAPAIAERLGTLWRLATTDDQRWELERLAQEVAELEPVHDCNEFCDHDPDDDSGDPIEIAREMKTAVEDAIASVMADYGAKA